MKHETDTWLEITTLLIPGENDSDEELNAMATWVVENLGTDVPWHFTAFHPDWKMRDVPATPAATLRRARDIALTHGVDYVYVGNVRDEEADSTFCPTCGNRVIGRDRYRLTEWKLGEGGRCVHCGEAIPGVFEVEPGRWGPRRMPARLKDFAN